MARLLSSERNGARLDQYWLHIGDDGKDRITVSSTEDVQPVFDAVSQAGRKRPGSDFHHLAKIPGTVIDETCRLTAIRWGVSRREAFAEIMASKTDRAKAVWAMLTTGRDLRKFQVQN